MCSRNSTADEVQEVTNGIAETSVPEKESLEAPVKTEKAWMAHEEDIPKNNLPLVFFSLLLATFLVCHCKFTATFCNLSYRTFPGCPRSDNVSPHQPALDGSLIGIFDSVATALPTIVAQLQGGQNYSWVGR